VRAGSALCIQALHPDAALTNVGLLLAEADLLDNLLPGFLEELGLKELVDDGMLVRR